MIRAEISPLRFDKLEILEIFCNDNDCHWIILPPTATFISDQAELTYGTPYVPEILLRGLGEWQRLSERCPTLQTLRLDTHHFEPGENNDSLIYLLRERRKSVEAGLEVEGVKMINLKTVIINFGDYPNTWISEVLLPLVEEVIELNEPPFTAEVEIQVDVSRS